MRASILRLRARRSPGPSEATCRECDFHEHANGGKRRRDEILEMAQDHVFRTNHVVHVKTTVNHVFTPE